MMDTDEIRRSNELQLLLNEQLRKLKASEEDDNQCILHAVEELNKAFENDSAAIVKHIQLLNWPLTYKRLLLQESKTDISTDKAAKFFLNPKTNVSSTFAKRTKTIRSKLRVWFSLWHSTSVNIERQYGSGVSSIFNINRHFFIYNIFMFILWFCLITLPFLILGSYSPPKRFTFDTIFNTRGYLENSLLFYGVYPNQSLPIRNESNNQHYHVNYPIPLIYLLCGYFYFIFWFIFIGIRFSYVYKNNVLDSILRSKRGNGFLSTFARWDYTIHEDEHKKEQIQICYNQLREIINHENNKRLNRKKKHDYYKSYYYIFKIVIINLLYVGLAVGLGIANYFLLSSKSSAMTSEHYQTLIFMSFINRFGPYLLTILAQFEKYKYPSYRLYTIGCRNLFLNASLIVSLIVYFYQQRSELEKLNNCWENGFGQIFYILSLIDIFFSIVSVLFFGSLMDLIVQLFLTDSIVKKSTTANSSMDKKNKKVLYKYSRMFDGINIHVQITPTQLLYSQLLIWIGTYFSPLLVLLQLLNILFSFWTYRFYIFLRDISCNQRRKIATIKRVYIWNAYRLNNMFYLLSFFCLTLAITCFVIFSTQLETSSNCGPFAHYNRTYEVIEELIPKQKSVVVVSIINFLSSPGLTYFGLIIFIIVAYKFKHEASAEKELVFIRESNLESKKLYRQKLVERLHNQTTQQRQPLEIVLTHKIEKSTL